MKKSILYKCSFTLFVFAFLFFSCENNSSKKNTSVTPVEVKTETPVKSFLDSVVTGKPVVIVGKTVSAGKPTIVPAGKPDVTSGFSNTHPVGKLATKANVMGKQLFGVQPKTTNAVGKSLQCINPKIVQALAAGMREQNPIGFKFFDIEQGLSSSYIRCMLQDHNGNIWFGTGGGGLCKYDGIDFIQYTEKQGLPNNFIVSIAEDHKGNIWFGTDGGGVCMYDGTTLTIYNEKGGLPNNAVWSMVEDHKGNMWFGTAGGGLCKFDGLVFTNYNKENGLNTNYIISMAIDSKGHIWFGSYGDGVCMYNGNKFVIYTETEGLSSNTVLSILQDTGGNMWFGTDGGGVCKYNGNTFTYFNENAGLSNNSVNAIAEDKNGNIWFGTDGGGVCKYNGLDFICYTEFEGLNSNTIQSILQDRNGNLWFGTNGHGVTKHERSCFTHFTKKEGLSNNAVLSSFEDSKHNLWFGTNGGGVCKYDGDFFYTYSDKEGLSNNKVRCIMEDAQHNIWFGTNGGASKFNGTTFTSFTEEEGLNGNKVYSLLQDHNGNIWFATQGGGISSFDGKTFTTYSQGLPNENIFSIIEDKNNNLWFGTDGGGAYKFDGKTFTFYTTKEGLSSNIIYALLQDKNGTIWLGTDDGGVCKYNGKTFTNYTEKNDISNNKVLSLLQDFKNNIWLGTESGITKINAASVNQKEITTSVYKLNAGFLGNDALQNSVCQDSKGFIWWGTGKMLTRYDPSQDVSDNMAPIMHLKDVKLRFESVNWNELLSNDSLKQKYSNISFTGVSAWYNLPETLSLPYNHNHIAFDYVGINFKSQSKLLYQYQLEGFEEKFSPLTYKTEAIYGNLSPGTYTFKVKAVNKDGIWSWPFSYSFTIRPAFWQTWWFLFLVAFFIMGMFVLVFRFRTNALRKRQHELEETIYERTAEVVSQKELVEEKQKEIVDSINYARRIQRSILPSAEEMQAALKNYFVLYKPKDIISGDFYWMATVKTTNQTESRLVVLAAIDCTGHGVPGALMSIVGNTLLNQTIKNININTPAQALDFLNNELPKNLKAQGGEIIRDGMDMAMCAIDFDTLTLSFAGANNPCYIISDGKLIELKADKQAISGSMDEDKKPFTNQQYQLKKGDTVYIFTDGYADQFGGPKGKKFKHKQLDQLLLYIYDLPLEEQREILYKRFNDWKGELDQVDDVTVIGIKI